MMNNSEHKGSSFSSLVFGMIIGAGLVWFFTKTKEGKETAERIKKKGEGAIENLSTLIEDIEKKGLEFKKKVEDVKEEIKEKFEEGKKGEVDDVAKGKLSKIEDLQQRGRTAAKKFFTKNGKALS